MSTRNRRGLNEQAITPQSTGVIIAWRQNPRHYSDVRWSMAYTSDIESSHPTSGAGDYWMRDAEVAIFYTGRISARDGESMAWSGFQRWHWSHVAATVYVSQ